MFKKKLFKAIFVFLLINLVLISIIHIFGVKFVTLSLKSDVPTEIQIFYLTNKSQDFNGDDSRKIGYTPGEDFTKIRTVIFTKYIDKFRIDFGYIPAMFQVSQLTISEGIFSKKVWNTDNLKRDFNYNYQIEINELNNSYFEFRTLGNDGFISGNEINGRAEANKEVILLEIVLFILVLILNYSKSLIKYISNFICKIGNQRFLKQLNIVIKEYSHSIDLENKFINSFLRENKYIVGILVFFSILTHGVAIFYYKIGIDSERAIVLGTGQGFTAQGRFGISTLKKIFSTDNIVIPAYNILLGIFMLVLFAILSTYIINKYSGEKCRLANLSFMIMFITFSQLPTYTTFIMYSFEVSMGYFIVGLSMLFITRAIFDKSDVIDLILGIVLLMFAISIYQSFITLYAAFVCFIFLMKDKDDIKESKKNQDFQQLLKYILVLIIALILYLITNFILTNSLINSEGYLGNFIGWKNYKFIDVTLAIFYSIKSVIFDVYGFEILKVSYIVLFIVLAVIMLKKRSVINVLCLVGLMAAPFLLNIILGSGQPIRSLVALPFFIGVVSYGFVIILRNKTIRRILFIFIFLCGMYQAQATSKLYFGDYARYNQDVELGNRISERIEELGVGERHQYPVVYIGAHSLYDKTVIIRNEVLGNSFFEWDGGNIWRIHSFMSIIGHYYAVPTTDNIQNAYENSKNMPVWPEAESVKRVNDIIIVKLSEPSDYWKRTNRVY